MVGKDINLKRRSVVKQIVDNRKAAKIITGLGSPTYDVFDAGDNDSNFYLWGAMGGAAMVGLGLAMANPNLPVIVITGDGEQLMGVGSLATIGVQKPNNLSIIVLDNGYYGETGMQKSHTSFGVDLHKIAKASNFKHSFSVKSSYDLNNLIDYLPPIDGPIFANIKVEPQLPPKIRVFSKLRCIRRFSISSTRCQVVLFMTEACGLDLPQPLWSNKIIL